MKAARAGQVLVTPLPQYCCLLGMVIAQKKNMPLIQRPEEVQEEESARDLIQTSEFSNSGPFLQLRICKVGGGSDA